MSSNRLSTFGQRLQSLSDSFYSTILRDCHEDKAPIRSAAQLEHLPKADCDDFTFDQCSISRVTSYDDFSFTFHSLDQPKVRARAPHSSTPLSIREENVVKKPAEDTRRRRTVSKFFSSSTSADRLSPRGHLSTGVSSSCHSLVARANQRLFHADESHAHEETECSFSANKFVL